MVVLSVLLCEKTRNFFFFEKEYTTYIMYSISVLEEEREYY